MYIKSVYALDVRRTVVKRMYNDYNVLTWRVLTMGYGVSPFVLH